MIKLKNGKKITTLFFMNDYLRKKYPSFNFSVKQQPKQEDQPQSEKSDENMFDFMQQKIDSKRLIRSRN